MAELEVLGPDSWRDFVAAPVAVLVLGKSDCEACSRWAEELGEFLADDEEFSDVRFGKLLLDQRGLIDFKKENPWIAGLDVLPFNQIYVSGECSKSFAGGGIDRLVKRLRRLRSG